MTQALASNLTLVESPVLHLLERVDYFRRAIFGQASAARRSALGQYPTPAKVAVHMASMFTGQNAQIRLLDAGAGVGSLTAAFVAEMCARDVKPREIQTTLFELDATFCEHLHATVDLCRQHCQRSGILFTGKILCEDFIASGVGLLQSSLFQQERFDCAILNPPYKKINSNSEARRLLSAVGIETSNLYTAFLSLALHLLENEGQLVAITPRSFCNGPYFKPFRQLLMGMMEIRQIHIYESRTQTFRDDEILQENIIFHAVKTRTNIDTVVITTDHGPDELATEQTISAHDLVHPHDPDCFIHIVSGEQGLKASAAM